MRLTKPGIGVHGLHITDNQVDASSGNWISVDGSGGSLNSSASATHSNVVAGNAVSGSMHSLVGTRISQSLHQTQATRWAFNLSSSLLFPGIVGSVQVSFAPDAAGSEVEASAPSPAHWLAADGRADGVVVVRTAVPASARVFVTVDQSSYPAGVQ